MATKWLERKVALTANQLGIESGQGDTPEADLQWTLTEIRAYFQGAGDFHLFVDDQLQCSISSESVANHQDGHVVGITIKQPVQFHWKFDDRSGGNNAVGVNVAIEETGPGTGP